MMTAIFLCGYLMDKKMILRSYNRLSYIKVV